MSSDPPESGYDLPETLLLRVGTVWSARLPGLGAAGYAWTATSSEPEVAVVGVAPVESTSEVTGGRPPGTFSLDEIVRIRALSEGASAVRLAQARPWEADRAPLRYHEVLIVVEAAESTPPTSRRRGDDIESE